MFLRFDILFLKLQLRLLTSGVSLTETTHRAEPFAARLRLPRGALTGCPVNPELGDLVLRQLTWALGLGAIHCGPIDLLGSRYYRCHG